MMVGVVVVMDGVVVVVDGVVVVMDGVVVVVRTWGVNGKSLSMNRHEGSEPESHSHQKKKRLPTDESGPNASQQPELLTPEGNLSASECQTAPTR